MTEFCSWLIIFAKRYKGESVENVINLNNSAIALTEANQPFEAIQMFRKALVLEPENPLLWLNLGIAQQKTGEYSDAIESFQHSLGIDNGLCEAWLSMGLIYYEIKEFTLAEKCYLSALSNNDNDPKTWNNLGVLYFTGGNFEEARHSFEEAVCLAPHYPEALFNLRDTCRELGDYRAAAEFERALSGISDKRGHTGKYVIPD